MLFGLTLLLLLYADVALTDPGRPHYFSPLNSFTAQVLLRTCLGKKPKLV
jgi:hypothetical protein